MEFFKSKTVGDLVEENFSFVQIDSGANVFEALKLLREKNVSAVPVWNEKEKK
jgi:hypothetical protein